MIRPFSHHSRPAWPEDRGLLRYIQLTGLEIPRILPQNSCWIDIGSGASARAMNELPHKECVRLISISAHPFESEHDIQVFNHEIPVEETPLLQLRGCASLITDVYGAVSYCHNPLHSIAYEALLLEPNGSLIVVSERNRFGTNVTLKTMKFILEDLGFTMKWEVYPTTNDSNGQHEACLRVTITRTVCEKLCLETIYSQIDASVGKPFHSRILWHSSDKKATISQVDYTLV